MSNALSIDIPKLSDGEAVVAILELANDPACDLFQELEINFFIGDQKRILKADFAADEDLKGLKKSKGRIIRSLLLKVAQGQSKGIHLNRTIVDSSSRHNQPPQLFDHLDIYPGQHGEQILDRKLFGKIVEAVHKTFRTVNSKDLGPLLGPDVQKHFVAREEALTRLESLAERILEGATEQRRSLDEEYLEKCRTLENEHKQRIDALEDQHRQRLEALNARESMLDKKVAELDDRSSTHVRRELREKLKEAIKSENRLKFTRETGTRRWAVVIGYALILLFTGIPAIYFLMNDPGGTWNPWHFGRQVALSISFLATAGFLVRWLNAWAEKSSAEEFRLKQMEIDIDRASWLVELLFESRRDQGEELPIDLVHQLSKNLFGVAGGEQSEANAADTLATALLTSASGLKFSLPGGLGEIAFDGKGIKKLEKKSIPNE